MTGMIDQKLEYKNSININFHKIMEIRKKITEVKFKREGEV